MPDAYHPRAREAVRAVLDQEHAAVLHELEARIGEQYSGQDTRNIYPHNVGWAVKSLLSDGSLAVKRARTRGLGLPVETIGYASPPYGTQTDARRAHARKRLLYARYRGWAQGNAREPKGSIGPAGEKSARLGLQASGRMQPFEREFGAVHEVLGVKLLGEVDTGGYAVPLIKKIPQPAVAVLAEVKNIRSWVYPNSEEIFQVLGKALHLQTAAPTQPVIPLLICRRARDTTYWMAQQLGFIVIEMEAQYTGVSDEKSVDEVRNELFFKDLRPGAPPSLRVRDRLQSDNLSAKLPDIAATWSATCSDPTAAAALDGAWKNRKNHTRRNPYANALRTWNTSRGKAGGW